MHVTNISMDSDAKVLTQSNRVMGVVDNDLELDRLTHELELVGVTDLEVLEGCSGEEFLHQWEQSLGGLIDSILGDMETEMRHQYLRELEKGGLVFAVPIVADNAREVVAAANAAGATHIASFGALINENFETPLDPKG